MVLPNYRPLVALDAYTDRQATPIGFQRDDQAFEIIGEASGHEHKENARLLAASADLANLVCLCYRALHREKNIFGQPQSEAQRAEMVASLIRVEGINLIKWIGGEK